MQKKRADLKKEVTTTTAHPTLTPSINIQQLLPTVFENPTLAPPTLTPSINIQQLLSTVFEQPLKNLYIVQFNKDHDNYTVNFNETGKRKKTEKMLTRSELLTKQGESERGWIGLVDRDALHCAAHATCQTAPGLVTL